MMTADMNMSEINVCLIATRLLIKDFVRTAFLLLPFCLLYLDFLSSDAISGEYYSVHRSSGQGHRQKLVLK